MTRTMKIVCLTAPICLIAVVIAIAPAMLLRAGVHDTGRIGPEFYAGLVIGAGITLQLALVAGIVLVVRDGETRAR
jgi:hypothetical protein